MPKVLPVDEERRRIVEQIIKELGGLPERTLLFSVVCIRNRDWQGENGAPVEVWVWEELTDDGLREVEGGVELVDGVGKINVHAIVELGQEAADQ